MDLVVKEMSKVTVPKDVLKTIDMSSLIEDFKSDYDQLDNLKKVRTKHEERNWFSQIWNSDELEEAQLDAAELQASFSKKLGQLMVISIEQSKLLTQQQDKLQLQQSKIKEQATELVAANVQLDKQQHKQMDQQRELEKLINDYFELKGITAKDAEKLILIANEVKEIKSNIFTKLEREITSIIQIKDSLIIRFEQEVGVFNSRLEKFEIELQSQLRDIGNKFNEKFSTAQKSFHESLKNTNNLLDKNYQTLTQANEKTNLHLSKLETATQSQIDELAAKIEQSDLLHNQQLTKQNELILLNNQYHHTELTKKDKQIKWLAVGVIISFLLGAMSLGFIVYPLLTKLN